MATTVRPAATTAMILAAGRGERMRPLTDTVPKALVRAGGKPLIVWHIEKLVSAGIRRFVINHAHLGALIEDALGDGARFGVDLVYSREASALETAGGIAHALSLLGTAPFLAVNADVFSDFDYARLAGAAACLRQKGLNAHLVLVANPAHHAAGDFALDGARVALEGARLTFSGMAVYEPAMFTAIARGERAPLAPLLRREIAAHMVSGELHAGLWHDVGTPARLESLERELVAR